MNKRDMEYLLDEEVFTVFNTELTSVNSNNNGIIINESLERHKRLVLKRAMEYLASDLVKVKKGYPSRDTQDITLTTDFVVMKRDTFNKIKKYINE